MRRHLGFLAIATTVLSAFTMVLVQAHLVVYVLPVILLPLSGVGFWYALSGRADARAARSIALYDPRLNPTDLLKKSSNDLTSLVDHALLTGDYETAEIISKVQLVKAEVWRI